MYLQDFAFTSTCLYNELQLWLLSLQDFNTNWMISILLIMVNAVYANYIGPSVMTDANCEEFPICDDRITENDRCVIKIIGIHCQCKCVTFWIMYLPHIITHDTLYYPTKHISYDDIISLDFNKLLEREYNKHLTLSIWWWTDFTLLLFELTSIFLFPETECDLFIITRATDKARKNVITQWQFL